MKQSQYDRMARAIQLLDESDEAPSLAEAAAEAGLSEFHFQRLFSQWAGISPKRFLQHRAAAQALALLRGSRSVLDAALAAGLSGPGRLHDLTVNAYAMTPGEIKAKGQGLEIRWGVFETPFGSAMAASTDRGICSLAFLPDENKAFAQLRREWPNAHLLRDERSLSSLVQKIFDPLARGRSISLCVRGTNFQLKVWEALLRIPEGGLVTYGSIARAIGHPRAVRAVGTAVGKNPVAFLIPCHRVIRSTSAFGGYRWGVERKRLIIACEGARRERAGI